MTRPDNRIYVTIFIMLLSMLQTVRVRGLQSSLTYSSSGRFYPPTTSSAFPSSSSSPTRAPVLWMSTKRIVFLGTPDVAAKALELLVEGSKAGKNGSTDPNYDGFEVVAVVSQPPAPAGRKMKLTPSPVQILAETLNIPVHVPVKAKDEQFLAMLEKLQPDLCVTAAYGNFLPKRFLAIPKFGTLNIHPSLLPKYRGAAPVQRCLENGDATTGITVAETALKMDSGPLVRQEARPLRGDEKAPDLLAELFVRGTELLLDTLPRYFDPSSPWPKTAQDDGAATPCDKISVEESRIDFDADSALKVHNKGRAFAGWPGIWSQFRTVGGGDGKEDGEPQRIKIITTVVLSTDSSPPSSSSFSREVKVEKFFPPDTDAETDSESSDSSGSESEGESEGGSEKTKKKKSAKARDVLRVACADGSVLGILELQPPGKKVMDARSFVNGLRGATLEWVPTPPPPSPEPEPEPEQGAVSS